MTRSPMAKVYGNSSCPYCGAARMLLTKKGIEFEDVNVGANTELLAEMEKKSGRRSVPQVFIGETLVGGFDELYALDQSGELDKLIGE